MQIPTWFENLAENTMQANDMVPSKLTIKALMSEAEKPDSGVPEGIVKLDIQYWLKKWQPLQVRKSLNTRVQEVREYIQGLDEGEYNEHLHFIENHLAG